MNNTIFYYLQSVILVSHKMFLMKSLAWQKQNQEEEAKRKNGEKKKKIVHIANDYQSRLYCSDLLLSRFVGPISSFAFLFFLLSLVFSLLCLRSKQIRHKQSKAMESITSKKLKNQREWNNSKIHFLLTSHCHYLHQCKITTARNNVQS